GSMKYAEGTGTNQPLGGTTVYQTPIGQYLSKPCLVGIWRAVPYYGLFSPTTFRPENLLNALGSLNNATFMGNPTSAPNAYSGTLRFEGWNFTFNEAPYAPAQQGLVVGGLFDIGFDMFWPSLTVDVELVFSFFDPPHAHSSYRGHNLV